MPEHRFFKEDKCTLCGECGPGECPKRVLGSSPEAEGGQRDWRHESQRLVDFIGRVAQAAMGTLSQMGCSSPGEASTDHLEALSYDAAATTGVALAGYGEPLPMWLH